MMLVTGSPLDYTQIFTTSQDTSMCESHGDGLQSGQKRKGLSNFIQDNMRAKTLSMVKISGTEGKQKCEEI